MSVDILSYFKQLLPVLENDESLYCISAWNDQVCLVLKGWTVHGIQFNFFSTTKLIATLESQNIDACSELLMSEDEMKTHLVHEK